MSAICHVRAGSGQYYSNNVWTALTELVDYLNDEFSSHSFYDHDLGMVSNTCDNYVQSDSGESNFVYDVMTDLKNDGELVADDNVIISHECIGFGYGGGNTTVQLDNGGTATGHAVYAGETAYAWEVEGYTWHELCHTYLEGGGDDHGKGTFDSYNGIHNVTPMGMGYVHDNSGEPDTHFSASGGTPSGAPSDFCFGNENFHYDGYRYYGKKSNHKLKELSFCTRQEISDWISNH